MCIAFLFPTMKRYSLAILALCWALVTMSATAFGADLPSNADADQPKIAEVAHTAEHPLRAGDTLRVLVRGTAGGVATFDIGSRAMGIALRESADHPGQYTGDYKVQPGDDVLRGHVVAHLSTPRGVALAVESLQPVTLDTTAPRISGESPANNATVDSMQPGITIYADDDGGSGLSRATLELDNAGRAFEVQTTINSMGVHALMPHPLSGMVLATARLEDAAGNSAQVAFRFVASGGGGTIKSVAHNCSRALQSGEVVTVEVFAPAGGRSSFDVMGSENRVIAENVAMSPLEPGRYRGTYTVHGTAAEQTLHIVGRYIDVGNQEAAAAASDPICVLPSEAPLLTVDDLKDGQGVGNSLTVHGHAPAHSLVMVTVCAEGELRKFSMLADDYQQHCNTVEVRADAAGAWTAAIGQLPRPPKVLDLQYVVTATCSDDGGRKSEPVSITVIPHS